MAQSKESMTNAVKVQVERDHLQRLADRKSPIQAVAVMPWRIES